MDWKQKGKVIWKFEAHFNADLIVGSKALGVRDPEMLSKFCMARFDPDFTKKIHKGDIMVAGKNFGYGNPHAEAILALKEVGVSVLIAQSFYPTWYRIAIFHAFPVVSCPDILSFANIGDELEIDIKEGKIKNIPTNKSINAEPFPEFLVPIMEDGGLVAHLKQGLN
jgi:3-isopropylmalate/(R)-2-methylmalate dehydratase small subunit